MIEPKYYKIEEGVAKAANDVNSMSDYEYLSATRLYMGYVIDIYDVVNQIAEKRPEYLEKAEYMAERYSRKLAEYYNAYYRNEARCPSINISGGSNFPNGKKEKQNSRRESLRHEWERLEEYAEKIRNLLTMKGPILSNDEFAIEKLTDKLEELKKAQENMKAANAYYRKNQTLTGCQDITEKEIAEIEQRWKRGWYPGIPYPPYELANNNKNIHATESRLEKLKKEKSAESSEVEYDGFMVRENTTNMRLQIIFEGKPDSRVRDILKRNGFHWSPKELAWQRQLTDSARYAMKNIAKQLETAANGQEA